LYAWHAVADVELAVHGSSWVIGAVTARGAVEVYERGFRAQFARPVLFAYADDGHDREQVARLGRRHGVAVCARGQLGERALAFGEPVPAALRP
jgi:hypothetical protein